MARLSFVLLIVIIFCIEALEFSWRVETSSNLNCVEKERYALLIFKRSLTDRSNRLRSWAGEDCCTWVGVGCDNRTGHVVELNLRNPLPFDDQYTGYDATYSKASLVGKELDSSLLELKHLKYLDLSWNNFSRSTIPRFLGSFHELRYLNLSCAWFNGKVPHELVYIGYLIFLLYNIWGAVNLSQATDWQHMINCLPSLSELHLSQCGLQKKFPSFFQFNLTRLTVLELWYNDLHGEIPDALCNITSLKVLDLSGNSFVSPIPSWLANFHDLVDLNLNNNDFSGQIPEFFSNSSSLVGPNRFGQLQNLQYLSLVGNSFSGPIPKYLGSLSGLRELHLTDNQLNGTVPKSIGQLSELKILSLGSNFLKGLVSEDHFAKLSKLEMLELDSWYNPLALKVDPHWIPPFQLSYLSLSSCKLGPKFPMWLRTQHKLVSLDLSNTSISAPMPNWFGNQTSSLAALDLSYNQIRGQLPHFSSNVMIILDLHNNSISGPLPKNIGEIMPALQILDLSSNLINGSIPSSVCAMEDLRVLDISKNYLSGDLPQCWTGLQKLEALRLTSNKLSGAMGGFTGHLHSLISLHLNDNNFHGEIPLSLKNSTSLHVLDLGENRLSGNIPTWIGEELSLLKILRLRSNVFSSKIPLQLCFLSSLQILDLKENNLSGKLPPCLGNITSMIFGQATGIGEISSYVEYQDGLVETIKGRELEYGTILSLVVNLDLSSNNFDGMIPKEITSLSGLIGLNLSRNHFTGSIPNEIGHLSSLESFDLSYNKLSGPIPQSISNLTSLSHFNLSYNKLSGRIPSGRQLQVLDDPSSIFKGNTELCGDAIEKKCKGEEPSQAKDTERDGNESTLSGLYISIASGFIIGFWGVCCSLIFKKSWRYSFFRFVDNIFTFQTCCPTG